MTPRMIVVTGGAGFIGSNIVARLCKSGAWDVVVCDRLETADLAKWKNIAKHPIADLWAPEELFEQLERHADRIEAVIHMGAISSTTEPDADLILRTNFSLSRDIWDWCAVRNVRMIYASSAATYGDGAAGFDDDIDALETLRPLNMYGYSKHLFDLWARREGLFPKLASLKFFNVFGPNEYHKGEMRSVVAKAYKQIRETGRLKLFKSYKPDIPDSGQQRDFLSVKDAVEVMAWLLEHPDVGGLYNVGAGTARTWNDLAAAVFAAMDRDVAVDYVDMPETLRGKYQYFTEAKMERLRAAGYDRLFTSLEDGIADYVRHYLAAPDHYL